MSLGVLGLGKIGSRVASYGVAFGMKVIGNDPFVSKEYAESWATIEARGEVPTTERIEAMQLAKISGEPPAEGGVISDEPAKEKIEKFQQQLADIEEKALEIRGQIPLIEPKEEPKEEVTPEEREVLGIEPRELTPEEKTAKEELAEWDKKLAKLIQAFK